MKTIPSVKKIRSEFGVTEYRLQNGLRVLHKYDRSAPVAAVCVTFHVGSRNEAPGHTGSTHILEHLLFKDSKKFNRKNGKAITDYLERFGALMNATTWFDRTNYYELMPRERVEEALAMEADRMRNSLFSDADLAAEMTVVRNEYERSRNNPFELLQEEVWARAFTVHPYRIPTIGTKEDIEGSTARKLHEFYNTFYWPDNATLAVFGDVSWAKLRPVILKQFGTIPSSPQPIPEMDVVEPEQRQSQGITLKKPMGLSVASLAYKTPAATHPDFPALCVLAAVLAGGFASRLQKKLIDSGLAAELYYSAPALRDPGLFEFTAHVTGGASPLRVLAVMRKEIAALSRTAPEREEVRRAKERLLSQFSQERDGAFIEVRAVSESIAAGDWMLAYRMERDIRSVSAPALLRAAKKYLTKTRETSGILLNE